MRGVYQYNFKQFDDVATILRDEGYVVFSPADMDRAAGFDPATLPDETDWSKTPDGFDLEAAFDRDVGAIKAADAIVMIGLWFGSHGACTEKAIAEWLGKDVLYWYSGSLSSTWFDSSDQAPDEDILDEAKRITSGDRNASYGPPDQDFVRTAAMWSGYLEAEVKPADVAWMMIMLKASRNKHQRKRDNWTDAAGYARCGAICDGVN